MLVLGVQFTHQPTTGNREMEAVQHKENWIPMISEGVILTMPQGGAIQYGSKLQAEVHARQYNRGWRGGAIPAQIEDVI